MPDTEPSGHSPIPSPAAPAPLRWLTLPNLVSLLRLVVFVPLTVWLIAQPASQLAATISLALFGATDWIDGALARGLGQVSRVGEILDPVADRLGLILISIALVASGYLPFFVLAVIVVCDLALLVIGLFRLDRVREGKVNLLGKARTALLMTAMPLHLLSFAPQLPSEPLRDIAYWMLVAGTALHLAAAATYAWRYLKPSPAVTSPAP